MEDVFICNVVGTRCFPAVRRWCCSNYVITLNVFIKGIVVALMVNVSVKVCKSVSDVVWLVVSLSGGVTNFWIKPGRFWPNFQKKRRSSSAASSISRKTYWRKCAFGPFVLSVRWVLHAFRSPPSDVTSFVQQHEDLYRLGPARLRVRIVFRSWNWKIKENIIKSFNI